MGTSLVREGDPPARMGLGMSPARGGDGDITSEGRGPTSEDGVEDVTITSEGWELVGEGWG